MVRILALVLFLINVPAHAEADNLTIVPDQPDLPAPVQSGQPMEPDVTIIRRGDESVEEYRMNHQVYRVKVTPVIGPSYTLEDINGDGSMDVRQVAGDNTKGMNINKWTLFSW